MLSQTRDAHAEFLDDIGSLLREYPPLDSDPARATAVAAALLSPVQQPGVSPELATDLAGMVVELEPDRAVPLLSRIAELGRAPVAAAARDALERLGFGDGSEHTPLIFIEGWRVEAAEADAVALDLGRRGDVEVRAFLLRDRRRDPAGVLVAGEAGAPMTDEDLRDVLPELDGAGAPDAVDVEWVAAWIRAGYAKAVEQGDPIPAGLSVALTLLAKPILGDADALPALEVDPTDVMYGEPDPSLAVDVEKQEEAAYELIDRLLDEYELYLANRRGGSREVNLGSCLFVKQTMLDYKAGYADGFLGEWTVSDLSEFVLDWWPRKVTADPETETNAPVAILRFLRFLDERGSLSGNPPAQLGDTMRDLIGEFVDACVDRSSWGPAKLVLMEAAEAGVDIHDRPALEEYFNQLAPRVAPAGGRSHRPARDARRARRKSARSARRRNRR